jgi:methylated-DNA-[protein]-cysteine S-methyltransferase
MTGKPRTMTRTMTRTHTRIDSPLGELTVVADHGLVVGLYFPQHWYMPDRKSFGEFSELGFEDVGRQLGEYFARRRRQFDLPLDPHGEDLQQRVWSLVRQVPYGETSTYGELARGLGDGTSPQEVGAAVGRNPLSVLVPCHRIVGRGGKLTGYAGGLERKRALLELEAAATEVQARLL